LLYTQDLGAINLVTGCLFGFFLCEKVKRKYRGARQNIQTAFRKCGSEAQANRFATAAFLNDYGFNLARRKRYPHVQLFASSCGKAYFMQMRQLTVEVSDVEQES